MIKTYIITVDESGTRCWYINGELHREDGPAVEWSDGSKRWYINDKLHREAGPAAEWSDGSKRWYINGELHREDGPAVEWADGSKKWYINGKLLTKEQFNARQNDCTGKIVEIDGVKHELKKV